MGNHFCEICNKELFIDIKLGDKYYDHISLYACEKCYNKIICIAIQLAQNKEVQNLIHLNNITTDLKELIKDLNKWSNKNL